VLRLYLYARVRTFVHILHTRPRVQQAPGIPCSLCLKRERNFSKARALFASREGDVMPVNADTSNFVMPGLAASAKAPARQQGRAAAKPWRSRDPGIHQSSQDAVLGRGWIAGSSPAMTSLWLSEIQIEPHPSLPATNAKRLRKGALATKQSILSSCPQGGLLRFARNDVDRSPRTGCPAFVGYDASLATRKILQTDSEDRVSPILLTPM
jgi:hypothetical protein